MGSACIAGGRLEAVIWMVKARICVLPIFDRPNKAQLSIGAFQITEVPGLSLRRFGLSLGILFFSLVLYSIAKCRALSELKSIWADLIKSSASSTE